MAKDLSVTWWIGFSDGSSPLPIENAPPGIKTIAGVSGVATATAGGADTVLSVAASCGACTGVAAGGFSTGSGAGAGEGGGALALNAGGSGFSATVGA